MNTDILFSIIRHALTTAGGALIANGLASESQISDAAGAIIVLLSVTWSIYCKRNTQTRNTQHPHRHPQQAP